ncbi:MAG: DJ-1/PfpI family protein [Saprospiraceae bacterium]|nr:DJ-1/PfpI family protein [Saprospiraceae bacterium]
MKLFASFPEFENIQGEHFETTAKKVAVVLFPGVEIIDFTGPWEVFGAAGMEVFSVTAHDSIVHTGMGMKLKPDYTFSNAPMPDIILVPGGNVDPSDTAVVNWIKRTSTAAEHTMSVCTGAFFLAAGGLLDSLKATTNYQAVQALKGMSPTTEVFDNARFVDNGRIITAGGLSAGIDAAFHLVSQYIGRAQTQKLANDLEYGWSEDDPFIRANIADKHVQDFLNAFIPFEYKMTEYTGDKNKWLVTVRLKSSLNQADLLRLLDYQLERVAGWKKSDKSGLWAFEEDGKKWFGELNHSQIGLGELTISLHVALY